MSEETPAPVPAEPSPASAPAPAPASPPAPAPAPTPPATPPPAAPRTDEKTWAMACHLISLAGYIVPIPVANVLGPLILWQIKKDEMPVVDVNGKESLNFQISILIYEILSVPLFCVFGVGFVLLAAVAIFGLVCVIIAAVNAANGKTYRYPLCIRMIK